MKMREKVDRLKHALSTEKFYQFYVAGAFNTYISGVYEKGTPEGDKAEQEVDLYLEKIIQEIER